MTEKKESKIVTFLGAAALATYITGALYHAIRSEPDTKPSRIEHIVEEPKEKKVENIEVSVPKAYEAVKHRVVNGKIPVTVKYGYNKVDLQIPLEEYLQSVAISTAEGPMNEHYEQVIQHVFASNYDSLDPLVKEIKGRYYRRDGFEDASRMFFNGNNIRYVLDQDNRYNQDGKRVLRMELPKTPIQTLVDGTGDCEDFSLALGYTLHRTGKDVCIATMYRTDENGEVKGHTIMGLEEDALGIEYDELLDQLNAIGSNRARTKRYVNSHVTAQTSDGPITYRLIEPQRENKKWESDTIGDYVLQSIYIPKRNEWIRADHLTRKDVVSEHRKNY